MSHLLNAAKCPDMAMVRIKKMQGWEWKTEEQRKVKNNKIEILIYESNIKKIYLQNKKFDNK